MKEIEISSGSESKGFEYTIPDDMEAIIKDGKVIVREKKSKDERIRKMMIRYFTEMKKKGGSSSLPYDDCLAYLESKKEQKPAEWGEEDKKMLETIDKTLFKASVNAGLGTIRCPYDDARDWLKSLRPQPHWKPSKDEITAIEVALKFLLAHTSDEQLRKNAISVIEHLKQL